MNSYLTLTLTPPLTLNLTLTLTLTLPYPTKWTTQVSSGIRESSAAPSRGLD